MHEIERVHLFFTEGSSDKEYQATLSGTEEAGYLVNFAFGRRGGTLKAGTKTNSPVPLEQAKSILTKLIAEKTAKGYTPDESGTRFAHTIHDGNASGVVCQLLNPITHAELERYLADDAWIAEQKIDGERRLLRRLGNEVVGINRRGLFVPLPASLVETALRSDGDFLIDGELDGETLHVFDTIEDHGADVRDLPWHGRQELLDHLLVAFGGNDAIKPVKRGSTTAEKRDLLDVLIKTNGEGIVLKERNGRYKGGRPNSGGSQMKFKLYETASVIVSRVNTQRSVAMSLIAEDGARIEVGNVTIPANQNIPPLDAIIEVRYLYAYRNGSLYQPTSLGVRADLSAADCILGQLKYAD